MQVLNNITTADEYTDDNTIYEDRVVKVNLAVNNAAIFVQLTEYTGLASPRAESWKPEVMILPGQHYLARKTTGCRVRSAAAGTPAQVTVELLRGRD